MEIHPEFRAASKELEALERPGGSHTAFDGKKIEALQQLNKELWEMNMGLKEINKAPEDINTRLRDINQKLSGQELWEKRFRETTK